MTTAEPIAGVVADLKAGRMVSALGSDEVDQKTFELARDLIVDPVVVDASTIFESIMAKPEQGVAIYEDHPNIAPPWNEFAICYVNTFGNAHVLHASAMPVDRLPLNVDEPPWIPAEPVDWDRVRWRVHVFAWMGGRSGEGPMPTMGPAFLWQLAIYDDGEPADIHWVHLRPDADLKMWDIPMLVMLGSLNFLSCRNVDVVEPSRPRGERRRLERIGVKVQTLSVYPAGVSTRTKSGAGAGGAPLSSVRGHFAHYGPDYGRKLLFGKLAGKFWIPQHARGDAAFGESQTDYRLRADR